MNPYLIALFVALQVMYDMKVTAWVLQHGGW